MSGFSINFSIDDREVRSAIDGMLALGKDLTPTMDEIGSYMENSTKARFQSGVGPDGQAWKISARAEAEGGQTLVHKTHLRDSIQYIASADEVEIGTNLIYAAIHQFGGVIRPKNAKKLKFKGVKGWAVVDQVVMPERPFIGASEEDEAELAHIILRDFAQAVGEADAN